LFSVPTKTTITLAFPFASRKREERIKTMQTGMSVLTSIKITQLKPNPTGKAIAQVGTVDPSKLAAEWVDITNCGQTTINTSWIGLFNREIGSTTDEATWKLVLKLPRLRLSPGQTLRVHAGQDRGLDVIQEQDRAGADFHCFSGTDKYIWKNDIAEAAGLWNTTGKHWLDVAEYGPFPPEDTVLIR
jgi:hypothetical protein